MTTDHLSRSRHASLLAMLFAALAVLCPGAAVAAPTVIDAPNSAPVSLLHGDTTPPRSATRPVGQQLADDRRRRNQLQAGGLRVRRRILRSRARRTSCGARPRPARDLVMASRTLAVPQRGPPVGDALHPSIDDMHLIDTHLIAAAPPGSRGTGGARSGRQAVTPAGVHQSLRRGPGTAQGVTRHPGRRRITGRGPVPCTSRRRSA